VAPVLEKIVGKRYRRAIGRVEVHGEIVPYTARPVGVYAVAADVRAALEAMAKDDGVKAALVDINSPGGAIVASREIARAIDAFPKPAVAWIRDFGASGAYEVAAACRRIIADRYSLVGSVGVILPRFEVAGLLAKLGVQAEMLKAGRLKDLGQPFRPLTEEERAILQGHLDEAHEGFLADVASRRRLAAEALAEIKTGLAFFGTRAHALGLIDRLGGYAEAIAACEELGSFAHDEVIAFKRGGTAGVLGRLIDFVSGGAERALARAGEALGSGAARAIGRALAAGVGPAGWRVPPDA
jgi:protease-4